MKIEVYDCRLIFEEVLEQVIDISRTLDRWLWTWCPSLSLQGRWLSLIDDAMRHLLNRLTFAPTSKSSVNKHVCITCHSAWSFVSSTLHNVPLTVIDSSCLLSWNRIPKWWLSSIALAVRETAMNFGQRFRTSDPLRNPLTSRLQLPVILTVKRAAWFLTTDISAISWKEHRIYMIRFRSISLMLRYMIPDQIYSL